MKLRIVPTSLLIVGLSLGVPGAVLADNLIVNGTFTDTTPSASSSNNAFIMDSTGDSRGTIAVTGWDRVGPNVYVNANASQNTAVWGPGNGVANGLSNSPAGGNLMQIDASAQYRSGIEQTVSGLTPGDTYQLQFYDGAAQQQSLTGPTTSYMDVNFGGDDQQGTTFNVASQGWSGWNLETMTFVANSTSETPGLSRGSACPTLFLTCSSTESR